MIRQLLYELEIKLVNLASDPHAEVLDNNLAMQSLVMDTANALLLLEKLQLDLDDTYRVQFMAVRKRILYYLAHFEFLIRDIRGTEEPTVDDLKAIYPAASFQEWYLAKKEAVNGLKIKTRTTQDYPLHVN